MILITKPFIPPLEEYHELIKGIWEREYFTNNGPLVQELESQLDRYLGVKDAVFVSNGTIALQIAIKALGLEGEIITTPFSYVATTSSIVWENCTPVFVDIEPDTFNIDPTKIEEAITSNTSAILTTHVFGNPSKIEELEKIGAKYNLKIIYDAAHCFGTRYKGRSIFEYGDISTTSFHATKLFHTIEGGGIFTKDPVHLERVKYMRNFGHDGPGKFNGVGINGKNSEVHAAMGLCNLNYIDQVMKVRKKQSEHYDNELSHLGHLRTQKIEKHTDRFNYAYYPVVFESEEHLLVSVKHLEDKSIFPRRYFYPSLSTLDYVEGNSPISEDISRRILCLPLYHDLSREEQDLIISTLKTS